jgi:hypothetical protein
MGNKIVNIIIASFIIAFLGSAIADVHGFNMVSVFLNAYALLIFISSGMFLIIGTLFFSKVIHH